MNRDLFLLIKHEYCLAKLLFHNLIQENDTKYRGKIMIKIIQINR